MTDDKDDSEWRGLEFYFKPLIYFENIWLELIEERHSEEFFRTLDSNSKVRCFTFDKIAINILDSRQKIKDWLVQRCLGNRVDYVIRERETNRFLGLIGILIDEDDNSAWLYYEISPNYWRRGVAFRAAQIILSFALSVPWITNLNAMVIEFNAPSISLLRKLNFKMQKQHKYVPTGNQFRVEQFEVLIFQY